VWSDKLTIHDYVAYILIHGKISDTQCSATVTGENENCCSSSATSMMIFIVVMSIIIIILVVVVVVVVGMVTCSAMF
jgi:hypothetical protein